MHAIPIDLDPFRLGDASDRRRVPAALDEAGRTSGFLAVTEHGLDPALLAEMMETTSAFFDLGPDQKMSLFVDDRARNRGYAPEGSEALACSLGEAELPTDLFDAFNAGREFTDEEAADPYVSAVRDTFFASNAWPTVPTGFRDVWLRYWDAVEELPTCCSADNPPRYRRVSSGDHLMAKLMGPRLLRPSETSPAVAR